VRYEDAIKCWAIGGRFQGKYWCGESEDQYLFITIPLEPNQLNRYIRPDGDETVEAPYRYKSRPWDAQYRGEDKDGNTGWNLRILDNRAYAHR